MTSYLYIKLRGH